MKLLVIGCGSIGERHIRNLKNISKRNEIFVFDLDKRRQRLMEKRYGVTPIKNLSKFISKEKIDGILICVPPSFHLELAKKLLKYNSPLFIEKPLSHKFNGIDGFVKQVKKRNTPVLIGYNLHFHPGIILVKKFIEENKIGRLLSVRIDAGQYLPDWRPWQDYRKSYTAKEDLGGGIILDGSHEINYLCWFLNNMKPTKIFCLAGKISDLEVETEDTAEILLKFNTGTIANIHLDFTQRAYSRSCKIIGTDGTIIWDYPGNKVKLYMAKNKKWQIFNLKFKPNDMYIEEMKHFLRIIQKKEKPRVSLIEGRNTLKLALSAKKSAKINKNILL